MWQIRTYRSHLLPSYLWKIRTCPKLENWPYVYAYMWFIRENSWHTCDKYEMWNIRFNMAYLATFCVDVHKNAALSYGEILTFWCKIRELNAILVLYDKQNLAFMHLYYWIYKTRWRKSIRCLAKPRVLSFPSTRFINSKKHYEHSPATDFDREIVRDR